jgi:L-seryl-tRNA(Ser) seleniumtransferase
LHYLKGDAVKKIPVWMMIAETYDHLDQRAKKWAERLRAAKLEASVIDAESTVGGGSLPGEVLPTRALALAVASPDKFAARLRENRPPIIARIEENRIVFDPRTVLASEEEALITGIERVGKI